MYRLAAVRKVGLPNPDYFIDRDDLAYTYAMMKAGYQGFIHHGAEIRQHVSLFSLSKRVKVGPLSLTFYELPPLRCYYTLRNTLYFAMYDQADGRWSALRELWRVARAKHAPVAPASGALELISASLTEVQTFAPNTPAASRRASIAVMPFMDLSVEAGQRGGAADALAYDVTTRLAKLRSMFVIAQASTFALRDRAIGPEEAGRMLNVDYVVSGATRRRM